MVGVHGQTRYELKEILKKEHLLFNLLQIIMIKLRARICVLAVQIGRKIFPLFYIQNTGTSLLFVYSK